MELDQDKLKKILYVAVPLLALLLGVGLGWRLKPDQVRVEEKVRVETVEKQVVVTQEKVRVEVVRVKDQQTAERVHREKTEEKRPDGTVVTKETEDRNIDTVVHDHTNTVQDKVKEVEKQVVVYQDRVKEVKTEPVLAQWHAGLLVGAAPRLDNPPATAVMVGLEAERRIVGPVWLGVWAIGGSPVTGFSLTNVSGGLKIGVEF